ncbi:hypothetical protein WG66_010087 [Moniliophthora roreri]|nr:hypothetical protein WG66_010087 [Moniliophthora roreri]
MGHPSCALRRIIAVDREENVLRRSLQKKGHGTETSRLSNQRVLGAGRGMVTHSTSGVLVGVSTEMRSSSEHSGKNRETRYYVSSDGLIIKGIADEDTGRYVPTEFVDHVDWYLSLWFHRSPVKIATFGPPRSSPCIIRATSPLIVICISATGS